MAPMSPRPIGNAANYIGRILSRARSRPIYRSCSLSKFDLLINLKTGKTLDLTIPPNVLALADEVIE